MGRAGRDGAEATCWLVLDDADQERLRSLSCSNAVELSSVQAFLTKVGIRVRISISVKTGNVHHR